MTRNMFGLSILGIASTATLLGALAVYGSGWFVLPAILFLFSVDAAVRAYDEIAHSITVAQAYEEGYEDGVIQASTYDVDRILDEGV